MNPKNKNNNKADNRMKWIRNLEETDRKESHWIEYEIATELFINGLFNYGNGAILCGFFDFDADENHLYHYLLKITYSGLKIPENPTKTGYGFPGGIIGELLALFSLYFRGRFYLVSSTIGELTDHSLKARQKYAFLHIACDEHMHPYVFSKREENWAGISVFLGKVVILDKRYHRRFVVAIDQYAEALSYIGIDHEMFYVKLVSSIEALSESLELDKNDDPLSGKNINSFLKDGLSDEDTVELRKVFYVRKSKKKFIQFVKCYSEGFFKMSDQEDKSKIKKSELESVLNTIYDARSDYLHSGRPMYISRSRHGFEDRDMDFSVGRVIDNKRFDKSKKLPVISWFEGVVRHCLLNYLERNTK